MDLEKIRRLQELLRTEAAWALLFNPVTEYGHSDALRELMPPEVVQWTIGASLNRKFIFFERPRARSKRDFVVSIKNILVPQVLISATFAVIYNPKQVPWDNENYYMYTEFSDKNKPFGLLALNAWLVHNMPLGGSLNIMYMARRSSLSDGLRDFIYEKSAWGEKLSVAGANRLLSTMTLHDIESWLSKTLPLLEELGR